MNSDEQLELDFENSNPVTNTYGTQISTHSYGTQISTHSYGTSPTGSSIVTPYISTSSWTSIGQAHVTPGPDTRIGKYTIAELEEIIDKLRILVI